MNPIALESVLPVTRAVRIGVAFDILLVLFVGQEASIVSEEWRFGLARLQILTSVMRNKRSRKFDPVDSNDKGKRKIELTDLSYNHCFSPQHFVVYAKTTPSKTLCPVVRTISNLR